MVDANDNTGLDAAAEYCHLISALCSDEEEVRLKSAAQYAHSQRALLDNEQYIELLQQFAASAQAFINHSSTAKFPNETPEQSVEFGPHFDAEFLVDFIEKHRTMLDDFEGAIVSFKFNGNAISAKDLHDFESYVRAYLHNIKGDAGAIGLIGIGRVTHEFEDMLREFPPSTKLVELLLYKEWVAACLTSFEVQQPLSESSEHFLQRLAASCRKSPPTLTAEPQSEGSSLQDNITIPTTGTRPAPKDARTYSISGDIEMISEFTAEAEDHLSNIESTLLEAAGVYSAENIDTIFRGVHSLKGASSFFNLIDINQSSHRLENILDEVRDGLRTLDPSLVSLVFTYIDLQKKLLSAASEAAESNSPLSRSAAVTDFLAELEHYAAGGAPANSKQEEMRQLPSAANDTGDAAASTRAAVSAQQISAKEGLAVKTFVKVDTNRLDHLIDSIGEMVIYSSILVRSCREQLSANQNIQKTCHQVEKFSRELQDLGMSMRLDPIRGLFQKMSRLVWDLSRKMKKDITFSMKGEDTELDRTVIEKLADPLLHMVRNAIDHAIESADERLSVGKPAGGTIELSASQEGGNIIIRIKDDGRGIDPEKIFAKAVEKGVIQANETLSRQDILKLIFAPGFSTASVVSDVSGRGVGMDVVRTNIESLRGRVDIDSEVGSGTTFTIELPLTLAIMDGIEAIVGAERFILPTLSIVELIKPSASAVSTTLGKGETLHFRGRFLPIFRLSHVYNIKPLAEDITDGSIAVAEGAGEQIALFVDKIVGNCQTVIKSLSAVLGNRQGLAGCSIMPNGEIGLILDVRSLIELARSEAGGLERTTESTRQQSLASPSAADSPQKQSSAEL